MATQLSGRRFVSTKPGMTQYRRILGRAIRSPDCQIIQRWLASRLYATTSSPRGVASVREAASQNSAHDHHHGSWPHRHGREHRLNAADWLSWNILGRTASFLYNSRRCAKASNKIFLRDLWRLQPTQLQAGSAKAGTDGRWCRSSVMQPR